jgi:hypothetical protein
MHGTVGFRSHGLGEDGGNFGKVPDKYRPALFRPDLLHIGVVKSLGHILIVHLE